MERLIPKRNVRADLFVWTVITLGAAALLFSIVRMSSDPPQIEFYYLAVLTIVSALMPIKLPKVSASISVAETFVFAGTLLYGPEAGTVLVFFDALITWLRLLQRTHNWHRMRFSLAASALSIFVAGELLFAIARSSPLGRVSPPPSIEAFIVGVIVFVAVYFAANTALIAVAIGLAQNVRANTVWQKNFSGLWLNYLAGGSLATLLVFNRSGISFAALAVIFPAVAVLFFGYRRSMERVEQAESHADAMQRMFLQTVEALAMAIDAKDQVTHGHIRRVQRHTMALANALKVTDSKQLDALRAAALLHDTGKLAVPEYILNKPGRLTSAEFARMKLHASIGADILKNIDFPYPVEPIVRHHHENWDGTGYPAGLKGEEIPVGARILSVVDCYDALTSDRPYRSRMTRAQAEQILRERSGTMYDPWVVTGFLSLLDQLERVEATMPPELHGVSSMFSVPIAELSVITTTAVEDQKLRTLRQRLSDTDTVGAAATAVFDYLEPLLPPGTCALYHLVPDSTEVTAVAARGPNASRVLGRRVPIGDRVVGWAFASLQTVVNAEAALELGHDPPGVQISAKLALVTPILRDGRSIAALGAFASEPFTEEHQRVVESVAGLLAAWPDADGNRAKDAANY